MTGSGGCRLSAGLSPSDAQIVHFAFVPHLEYVDNLIRYTTVALVLAYPPLSPLIPCRRHIPVQDVTVSTPEGAKIFRPQFLRYLAVMRACDISLPI